MIISNFPQKAGGVESFNGRTGAVVPQSGDYTAAMVGALPNTTIIPSKTSDLTNDSNFITAAGAPVQSVAGKTGAVTLDASDVGAVPTTRKVNNKPLDEDITITAAELGAITSETQLSKGTTSGPGNAVTDISVNNHQITLTKGETFATKAELEAVETKAANAMTFIGTLGTGGTTTDLPDSPTIGDTYKVITAGTYASIVCKVGDMMVYSSAGWVMIPSGDEPSGTVTNVATGTGLTGGPITNSGTISHADTSSQESVTASGRTYITGVTLDDFGHVTGLTTGTETVTDTTDLTQMTGTLGVGHGGTGATTLTSGSYLVGNGGSAVSLKTPAQVLSDIGAEASGNKVTSLSSASTDAQYPSAKCVYDIVGNVETLLAAI